MRTVSACLDFCYLVRRSAIDEKALRKIEEAVSRLHRHRKIFESSGVRNSISLPRQHSIVHYGQMIRLFGAPTGISTSITESKHKQVVKGTYTRTNKFHPLMQMLLVNSRLDKLSAARTDFERRGMLELPVQLLSHDGDFEVPEDTSLHSPADTEYARTELVRETVEGESDSDIEGNYEPGTEPEGESDSGDESINEDEGPDRILSSKVTLGRQKCTSCLLLLPRAHVSGILTMLFHWQCVVIRPISTISPPT